MYKDQFGVTHKEYKDYIRDGWNRKETDIAYKNFLEGRDPERGWEGWFSTRLHHDET